MNNKNKPPGGGSFLDKLDQWLGRAEKKGFQMANKLHVYTINAILLGLCYGTWTLVRDYNEFFKAGRVYYYRFDLMV
jgi:hypothetical protein